MAVEAFIESANVLIDGIARYAESGHEAIETIAGRFSELRALVKALSGVTAEEVENDPRFRPLAERARGLYGRFYGHVEVAACLETVVRGRGGELAFVSNNDALAEDEVTATHLARDSHLGFVGCGSFPWSVVRYQDLTGCRLTGIDCDPLAIHLAHESLQALGIRQRVQLLEADARDVDYGPFSHVVVAAMATPKEQICARVLATAHAGAHVVVRAARGLNQLFYEGFVPDRVGVPVVGHVEGAREGELSSWVLRVER